MKVLRRSLKSSERERSSHNSITPKSEIAIIPPKKVIRALYDYESQSARELSFQKGDFFHVIGRENDANWYEACNPALPDARGLVPVSFFQSLGKTERDSSQSEKLLLPVRMPEQSSEHFEKSTSASVSSSITARSSKTMGKGAGSMVYGIVMYDFISERSDELDAKAGEPIIVIAQSNPEWFVAKPIGRLGGPGLIPVSFIEIRDTTTGEAVPDALEAVQRARVPRVEEWKRMAAEYKNSSISLGKFEVSQSQHPVQQIEKRIASMTPESCVVNTNETANLTEVKGRNSSDPYVSKYTSSLPAPISARVPRYCHSEDKYWFIVEVQREDGRFWEMSRFYEDFYDFQIQLLSEFPVEAGNTGQQKRTLPYMPGPVSYVTDSITEGRQNNLDAYVINLLSQPPYISRCQLVKQFFTPREGDIEISPKNLDEYRLSGESLQSSIDSATDGISRLSSRGNNNFNNPSGLSATPQRSHVPSLDVVSMSVPSLQMSSMKVKIYFGDDLIAIRVPADIQFEHLSEKIRERLKIPSGEIITLSYKDENSSERPLLMNNNDLDLALSRNDKLVIYVE